MPRVIDGSPLFHVDAIYSTAPLWQCSPTVGMTAIVFAFNVASPHQSDSVNRPINPSTSSSLFSGLYTTSITADIISRLQPTSPYFQLAQCDFTLFYPLSLWLHPLDPTVRVLADTTNALANRLTTTLDRFPLTPLLPSRSETTASTTITPRSAGSTSAE